MYHSYPFYSRVRGTGVVDAYHSHPACPIAQSIAPCYRFAGNPHQWPECTFCLLLRTPLPPAARASLRAPALV